jgi:hypothetical protein
MNRNIIKIITRPRRAKKGKNMENKVYDKAKWHFESCEQMNYPPENAYTHIAWVLNWLIVKDFVLSISEQQKKAISDVKRKKKKASAILRTYYDGCLLAQNFTCEANAFLAAYYEKVYFNDIAADIYHSKDTWEQYAWISEMLNNRWAEWQATKKFTPYPKPPKMLFGLVGSGKASPKKWLLFAVFLVVLLFLMYLAAKQMYRL